MGKGLALNHVLASFSLQLYIKEDALVKFKSELAVMELEVQVKISCHLTFYAAFSVAHISLSDTC